MDEKDRKRTRLRPLTMDALASYGVLSGLPLPEGPFDPGGAWKHMYRIWMVAVDRSLPDRFEDIHYFGFLEIERKPLDGGGGLMLRIDQTVPQQDQGVHVTAAELRCAGDALASPRSWKLTNTVLDARLAPVAEARVEQTGTVGNGGVEIDSNGRKASLPVAPPLTANWCLFDAVQRLPRSGRAAPVFTLLHELDQPKPCQRLYYRGSGDHTVGGERIRLHEWQHVGRGLLPYSYYTDERGRLLAALGGMRAYLLDPSVRETHEEYLEWLRGREER